MQNTFLTNSAKFGGAIMAEHSYFSLVDNMFQNNSATFGGAIELSHDWGRLTWNTFQNNSGYIGGAILDSNSNFTLMNNIFQNNSAYTGGAIHMLGSKHILISNAFQRNSASTGGALYVHESTVILTGSTFYDNSALLIGGAIATGSSIIDLTEDFFHRNRASYGGGLYVNDAIMRGSMILTNNSATEGGAVCAYGGQFLLDQKITIANNVARNGGGLWLSSASRLHLQPDTTLQFSDNIALETGGAIHVKEIDPVVSCNPEHDHDLYSIITKDCFFQVLSQTTPYNPDACSYDFIQFVRMLNISMIFESNSAADVGDDLYGGLIDTCSIQVLGSYCYDGKSLSGLVFDIITNTSDNVLPDISSDPLSLCICRNEQPDFSVTNYTQSVYPGGRVEVPVAAYGQRNQSTKAVVLLTHKSEVMTLEYAQYSISKGCSTLKYTIHSHVVGISQRMTLTAKGPCSPGQTVGVTIDIKDCPPGFQLLVDGQSCDCSKKLQDYTDTCLIDNGTILRRHNAEFWVGYSSGNINDSGLILHPHCPLITAYRRKCSWKLPTATNNAATTEVEYYVGSAVRINLSLVFGSSRCLRCSNSHLSLLVAFALAGIALVLLLLILRLTVAAGTINGLIFYANIVTVYSTTFFRPKTANVLTVFIAWLNLDLGIETCFFNGMDTYITTWLQFVFPVYVWGLVSMMIIVSHYSTGRIARLFGRNPVAVLATLFMLSYTKLLRTAIVALSYTTLMYPNSWTAVWLYDGNVAYLRKKHIIPLFVAALGCLMFLSLPYTTLLTVAQWLQAKSICRVLSWINSCYIISFLDAYHAPYSTKHRYWVGLMLLLRFVLLLISAVNALGDPRINLLAVASSLILVTPAMLASTRIYKSAYLCFLEVSFLVNLSILVLTTLYIYPNEANQNAVTFTSISIALATFIGVVIFHSIEQIKGTELWRKLFPRHGYVRDPLDDGGRLEDPPDRVYERGCAPTQTVVDLRELRQEQLRMVGNLQVTSDHESTEHQERRETVDNQEPWETVELREPCISTD